MHIVAIAWIYVVLMMSIAEHSLIAGIMTFMLYGALPLTIILYVMGTPQRRRKREAEEKARKDSAMSKHVVDTSETDAANDEQVPRQ
jgi:hypothetical protein